MSNKLKAVIALLASDQQGEVANAAAMLVRILKADGKDLHWLAALAAGEKPSPPGSGHDAQLFYKIKMLEAQLQIGRNELRDTRKELAKAHGLNAQLAHELQMIRQSAQAPIQPDPVASFHKAYAQAQNSQTYWSANPYGGQQQSEPDWRDMAEWAYKWGGRTLCLSADDVSFLLEITSRKYRKLDLSYKQRSWLQDIYDRVRRVQASR